MNKKTILIVDDTLENLEMLSGILKQFYIVKATTKGVIALKIALTKPDLILLDIQMPDLDGFEVCKKLKDSEVTKDIPVIFLSGNTDKEEIEESLALGAVCYLHKPIDLEKMFDVITKFVS